MAIEAEIVATTQIQIYSGHINKNSVDFVISPFDSKRVAHLENLNGVLKNKIIRHLKPIFWLSEPIFGSHQGIEGRKLASNPTFQTA